MTTDNKTQGTVKVLKHDSEVLKNNPLGDPHLRDVYVYLPPDYDDERRFPVIYNLTGFTGRGKMFLNDNAFTPNFAERMDKLIGEKTIKPMIVVMPDCFTKFGGSQYVNSSATGDYEDYLTKEIVPFIDENLKTINDRSARAVMGKSSGGYGALVLAMRRADIFGLACSTSGDCYFEYGYFTEFPKAFRGMKGDPMKLVDKFYDEKQKKGQNDFDALNILAMSACYSPDPESQYGFDLPFDLATGERREEICEKWLAHDPVRMVEKYSENLKKLKLLYIDAGSRDEFFLDIGARILCDRLNKLGIDFIHEEFDDGHRNISYRADRSLELISKNIGF